MASGLELRYLPAAHLLQEGACPDGVVARVGPLNHDEEKVVGAPADVLVVEHGVVVHRQPVQEENAADRRERREEDRQLVGHREGEERGEEGLAAHGQGEVEAVHVPDHGHARHEPGDPAAERDPRHPRAPEPHGAVEPMDRERRDAVPAAVAGVAHLHGGAHDRPGGVKRRYESVGGFGHGECQWRGSSAGGSAWGGRAFSSAIAMIGQKRTKSRKRTEKTPNVPKKVKMSTTVGEKYPQLDGRKSRASEVEMMTKRSNHIPRFTKRESIQTSAVLRRTALNQKNCVVITLQVTMIQ